MERVLLSLRSSAEENVSNIEICLKKLQTQYKDVLYQTRDMARKKITSYRTSSSARQAAMKQLDQTFDESIQKISDVSESGLTRAQKFMREELAVIISTKRSDVLRGEAVSIRANLSNAQNEIYESIERAVFTLKTSSASLDLATFFTDLETSFLTSLEQISTVFTRLSTLEKSLEQFKSHIKEHMETFDTKPGDDFNAIATELDESLSIAIRSSKGAKDIIHALLMDTAKLKNDSRKIGALNECFISDLLKELRERKIRGQNLVIANEKALNKIVKSFESSPSIAALTRARENIASLNSKISFDTEEYRGDLEKILSANGKLLENSLASLQKKRLDRLKHVYEVLGSCDLEIMRELRETFKIELDRLQGCIQDETAQLQSHYKKIGLEAYLKIYPDLQETIVDLKHISEQQIALESLCDSVCSDRKKQVILLAKDLHDIRFETLKKYKGVVTMIQAMLNDIERRRMELMTCAPDKCPSVILEMKSALLSRKNEIRVLFHDICLDFEERYDYITSYQSKALHIKATNDSITEEWSDLVLWESANQEYKQNVENIGLIEDKKLANMKLKDVLGHFKDRYALNENVLNQALDKFDDFCSKIKRECQTLTEIDDLILSFQRRLAQAVRLRRASVHMLTELVNSTETIDVMIINEHEEKSKRGDEWISADLKELNEKLRSIVCSFYETSTQATIRVEDLPLETDVLLKRLSSRLTHIQNGYSSDNDEMDIAMNGVSEILRRKRPSIEYDCLIQRYHSFEKDCQIIRGCYLRQIDRLAELNQSQRLHLYNRLRADKELLASLDEQASENKMKFEKDLAELIEESGRELDRQLTGVKEWQLSRLFQDTSKFPLLEYTERDLINLRNELKARKEEELHLEQEWEKRFATLLHSAREALTETKA